MAAVVENKKNGKIISVRIQVYGKDAYTNKPKLFVKTFPVDQSLSVRAYNKYVEDCTYAFRKEVEQAYLQGRNVNDKEPKTITPTVTDIPPNISLIDYANIHWMKSISSGESTAYPERAIGAIERFKQFFGDKPLKDITRVEVVRFFDYLSALDIHKPIARGKKNITMDLLKKQGCSLRKYEKDGKLTRNTTYNLRHCKPVRYETAVAFCKDYNLPYDEFFETLKTEEQHYSKETILGYKRMLHTVINHAIARGIREDNPVAQKIKITLPSKHEECLDEERVLNTAECKNVLRILDEIANKDPKTKFLNHRIKIAIELPLLTGMRLGEVCALSWDDIDFERQIIKVRHSMQYSALNSETKIKRPKTKSSIRNIDIRGKLLDDLREFKALWDEQKELLSEIWDNENGIILTNDIGKPLSVNTPYHWWQNVIQEYGLKKLSYHDLRHTHITQLLTAGVDVRTVANRVGHANPEVTLKVYSHFLPEAGAYAAEKIDQLYAE